MKKVSKTTTTPDLLGDYFQNNPFDSWQQFYANNGGPAYKQLKNTLIGDQRGLCAYCEIDLAQYAGDGLDDFRVEPFHPKSPTGCKPMGVMLKKHLRISLKSISQIPLTCLGRRFLVASVGIWMPQQKHACPPFNIRLKPTGTNIL
jgi:hypothetical protein